MNSGQPLPASGSGHNGQCSDGQETSSARGSIHMSDAHNTSDHDMYDVSFDGDDDPMSPKSLPLIRKWAIVIIVCTGTMCV